MGIHNGADLKNVSRENLKSWFGKAGEYYYEIVRGIDNREVIPFRENKSIGAEQTFETDISDQGELKYRFESIIERAWKRIERHNVAGRTLTLKVKFFDFEVISRGKTFDFYIETKDEMVVEATNLLVREMPFGKPVRLLGITLSNFMEEDRSPLQTKLEF